MFLGRLRHEGNLARSFHYRLGHAIDVPVHAVKQYLNPHAHCRFLTYSNKLPAAHRAKPLTHLPERRVCNFYTQRVILASLASRPPLSCCRHPSVEAIKGLSGKTLKRLFRTVREIKLQVFARLDAVCHTELRNSGLAAASRWQQRSCGGHATGSRVRCICDADRRLRSGLRACWSGRCGLFGTRSASDGSPSGCGL